MDDDIRSVPLLQDRFSNNDYLEVRVRVTGHQGYTKGEVRVLWQELDLKKWGTTKYIMQDRGGKGTQ